MKLHIKLWQKINDKEMVGFSRSESVQVETAVPVSGRYYCEMTEAIKQAAEDLNNNPDTFATIEIE